MTLPSNPSINPQDAAQRLDNAIFSVWREATAIKNQCVALNLTLHDLVASRLQAFISLKTEIDTLLSLSGIDSAYETRFQNKTFTFSTDASALSTGIQTLITFIVTQIPANGVWLNTLQFSNPGSGDYTLAQRVVTSAPAISPLEDEVDDLLALIDVT